MTEKEGKRDGKKCPYGFGEGGSGHGICPYGFGSRSHGHGHGFGHGGPGHHCPYLQGHGPGHFGPGFGGAQHGFGHHPFDHHGGKPPMLECPWMVARLHACPWAWGVGSGHHGGHHYKKSGKSSDFCVTVKVADFCSEELEVKVLGQEVIVHGQHEPRPDAADSSIVAREFTRRYQLPDNIDPQTIASSMTEDHELVITAAKKVVEGEPRVVPIQVGEGSGDH